MIANVSGRPYQRDLVRQTLAEQIGNSVQWLETMLYLLRPGVAQRLAGFVKRGGTLVGAYQTGLADENDLCFEGRVPHDLTDVFGLYREEIDSLWDGQSNRMAWNGKDYTLTELCERVHPLAAQTLSVYAEDFYAGEPALTLNAYGAGKAYYLAAKAEDAFLTDFYRQIAPQAGAAPCLDAELPAGVTVTQRETNDTEWLFLQNWNDKPATVVLRDRLADAETERPVQGELILEGYTVRILKRNKAGAIA